jgi:hypothetical protein
MIPLAVKAIKEGFRISPYTPGAAGTAVASFLAGRAPLTAQAVAGETTFVDAVHLAINTIMPNDFSSWDTIDELVQQGPVLAPLVCLGSCRVCARRSGARTTIGSAAGPDQDLHDRQEHDHEQQRPEQP